MQGFNMGRYVPPDLEGTTSGNSLHRKRPPGRTADGGQTVRFEMPFAIWCGACPKPTIIGQGVRFNASKVREGSYHSTPIWLFRMRHADCGGQIEIRTDPKNTAYVVVSGAKKRDHGDDDNDVQQQQQQEGGVAILTDAERDALRQNAFASLEKTIADRQQLVQAAERIDALAEDSNRLWADPYAQNQRLRRAFRPGRRDRERQAERTGELQERMGLGLDLLPESEDDARRAALVDFGAAGEDEDADGRGAADKARAKPLFATTKPNAPQAKSPPQRENKDKAKKESTLLLAEDKRQTKLARQRESFAMQVVGNTRAAKDPFLNFAGADSPKGPSRLPGVKRKRREEDAGEQKSPPAKVPAQHPAANAGANSGLASLVDYDSD